MLEPTIRFFVFNVESRWSVGNTKWPPKWTTVYGVSSPFGDFWTFFWNLDKITSFALDNTHSTIIYIIVWTNFLVRTQKYLYFYCIKSLPKVTATFRSIFGGHLVAELQQHWAKSGLGWVTAEKLGKFFFSFFHDFLSFRAFWFNFWPYEFIRLVKWSIFCSR